MNAILRTFIALPASGDAQNKMAAVQSTVKTTHADVHWEPGEKFHLTLKFLGDTHETDIDPIADAIREVARAFAPLSLRYSTLGAFPNADHPRIVWIGAHANDVLSNLHSAVETACAAFGFPQETRLFQPHITLGRVKGTRNIDRLTEAIKTTTFESIESLSSAVVLVRSDLRPGGSVYTTLKSFPLHA